MFDCTPREPPWPAETYFLYSEPRPMYYVTIISDHQAPVHHHFANPLPHLTSVQLFVGFLWQICLAKITVMNEFMWKRGTTFKMNILTNFKFVEGIPRNRKTHSDWTESSGCTQVLGLNKCVFLLDCARYGFPHVFTKINQIWHLQESYTFPQPWVGMLLFCS